MSEGQVSTGTEVIANAALPLVVALPLNLPVALFGPQQPVLPVITLAQPILFLALVTAPLGALARLFAEAVHPLLFAFDWIAWSAASVPGAALTVSTTLVAAVLGADVLD